MKILRKLNRISAPKLEASRSNFIFVVFIFFILYVEREERNSVRRMILYLLDKYLKWNPLNIE